MQQIRNRGKYFSENQIFRKKFKNDEKVPFLGGILRFFPRIRKRVPNLGLMGS